MTPGKYLWIVPLLVALLVAGAGWWTDGQLRETIEQELRSDLQSTLEANVTALEIWMSNQKRIAAGLAEEPRFKSLALELFDLPTLTGTNRPVATELSRQLISGEHLPDRLRILGYGTAPLVSVIFNIVADTGRGRGRDRQGTPVFEELQNKYAELFARGEPILITPFKMRPARNFRARFGNELAAQRRSTNRDPARARDQTAMQVAAPLKDPAGAIRGAVALIINPDAEFTRILSVARSGESGETFAFDEEGLMISESRFDHELKQLKLLRDEPEAVSALTLSLRDPGGDLTEGFVPPTNAPQALMLMVEQARARGSGVETKSFRDYRGVPVVGAWRWLPKYGFGVGTKIDASEAFQTSGMVRRIFLLLFLLLVLASLVILLFSYKQVIWRRQLSEAQLKARQLGQYKIVEKIGEGGMGVVYKAHHSLLRRETALKLLLPEKADPEAVARFEREVRLTCQLTHPNTIQVYDYGHTPDGIFYYAMEYLDGLNLQQLVRRHGPQPEERVAYILGQICESLSEAHGVGLIHRDIKPANIFLCDRGAVPDSVKVLDFGLVKRLNGTAKESNTADLAPQDGLVGTPNFIAPETISPPHFADVRSDLYSLGVLGYWLLTGQEIFEAASVSELCRRHVTEIPVRPGIRIGKIFNEHFENLLMTCLQKNPDARPQSAQTVAEQLGACGLLEKWTFARRATWWLEYRASANARSETTLAPTSILEKTVKIEIGLRRS